MRATGNAASVTAARFASSRWWLLVGSAEDTVRVIDSQPCAQASEYRRRHLPGIILDVFDDVGYEPSLLRRRVSVQSLAPVACWILNPRDVAIFSS